MKVTLYVWKMGPENPGHVSLQIGDAYASYWPSEAGGKKDVKIGQRREVMFPPSYRADVKLEHKPCDEHRDLVGLDCSAMILAWEKFREDPPGYNLLDHNCSTVIAALLHVGSAVKPPFVSTIDIDRHVKSWALRVFLRIRFMSPSIRMWTPDAVLRYADEIQAKRVRS